MHGDVSCDRVQQFGVGGFSLFRVKSCAKIVLDRIQIPVQPCVLRQCAYVALHRLMRTAVGLGDTRIYKGAKGAAVGMTGNQRRAVCGVTGADKVAGRSHFLQDFVCDLEPAVKGGST